MRLPWNTALIAALISSPTLVAQYAPAAAMSAAPTPVLAHQGRVLEAGQPVTGLRTFTFSILDGAGAELWNSGSQSVSVDSGLYKVDLGAAPMPTLPETVLAQPNLKLRVVVSGLALAPDTDLVPTHQAHSTVEGSDTVARDLGGNQAGTTMLALQGRPLEITKAVPVGPGLALVRNGTASAPGNVAGTPGPQRPVGPAGPAGPQDLAGAAGPAGGLAGPVASAGSVGSAGTNWNWTGLREDQRLYNLAGGSGALANITTGSWNLALGSAP